MNAALAAGVRRGLPDVDLDEVAARAAWTLVADPGDRIAGSVVAAGGPARALDLVRSGVPAPERRPSGRALNRALPAWRERADPDRIAGLLRAAAAGGVRLLVPGDPDWPAGVDDLGDHAPIALWLRGDAAVVPRAARSVAVVGARAATDYGVDLAIDLAAGLVDRGFAVVSGAAYGIDAAAHRSALVSGGPTVAVLAGGLDRLYPAGNRDLLATIEAKGAILSEAPYGTAPTKWRFLRRNRVIAAMSRATVVVEAGHRSGAINTAGHAAQLGRPLGAVPGSVRSAASAGCHRLLREYAAVCVRDAADAAELAEPSSAVPLDGVDAQRTEAEARVLAALDGAARPLEEVARRAGLGVLAAMSALGLLALTGEAAETPGGWALG